MKPRAGSEADDFISAIAKTMPASTTRKQFSQLPSQEELVWQPHPQYGKAEALEGEPNENARDDQTQNVRCVQFPFPITVIATSSGIGS
jgi:hypothetical protein